MDYGYKTLEEKMKSLPPDLQGAMVSTDTADSVQSIGEKHELNIDQSDILAEVTSLVMLGLLPLKNFANELSREAKIDLIKAIEISKDINEKIFASVQESLKKMQAAAENSSADIEKAGNLTVERDTPDQMSTDSMDKVNILNSIENADAHSNLPVNILPQVPAPQTVTPSLVGRLMNASTATSNEKVEKKLTSGPDPYREPIE
jgi:hypothetical protein